jgi:Protein of unknown function (DUF2752)
VAVCLVAPLAPQIAAALPECLFHAVTGLPCPTCGATRAVLALSHLDLAGAAAMNPLAALGAAGFVLGGLAAGIAALTGRSLKPPDLPAWALRAAALFAVAANWVWLLVHPAR